MHNLLNDMQLFVVTLFSLIAKSTYVAKKPPKPVAELQGSIQMIFV